MFPQEFKLLQEKWVTVSSEKKHFAEVATRVGERLKTQDLGI